MLSAAVAALCATLVLVTPTFLILILALTALLSHPTAPTPAMSAAMSTRSHDSPAKGDTNVPVHVAKQAGGGGKEGERKEGGKQGGEKREEASNDKERKQYAKEERTGGGGQGGESEYKVSSPHNTALHARAALCASRLAANAHAVAVLVLSVVLCRCDWLRLSTLVLRLRVRRRWRRRRRRSATRRRWMRKVS